jgi:hypothetical protein
LNARSGAVPFRRGPFQSALAPGLARRPPAPQLRDAGQAVGHAEGHAHYVAVALACRDRLLGQGVHLAAYSTAESAADVNHIRLAPGYRRLEPVDVSYGTYPAQAVMRAFPQAVQILEQPQRPRARGQPVHRHDRRAARPTMRPDMAWPPLGR